MGRRGKERLKPLKKQPSSPPSEVQAAHLRALVRLNQLISSSLASDQLLLAIAKAAAELMHAEMVSFWTVDEAAETLTVTTFSNERLAKDFPLKTLGFDEGCVGWVAKHRQPLDVPDVHADTRLRGLRWWSAHKLASFFGVPVISGDSLLAVLAVNSRTPLPLDAEERGLLDMFVAQAAIAIRNARLFSESEARRKTAEALAEVGRVLSQGLDPDLVGRRIAESVRSLLGVLSAAVYQHEPESGSLFLLAESTEPEAGFEWTTALAPGHGVAGLAASERRTVITSDASSDQRLTYPPEAHDRIRRSAYRALMAMPLVGQDRVVGALVIGHRAGRVFTPAEAALGEAFASHAAVALENARLFAVENATRRQLEALAEVEREFASELNLDHLLDIVIEQATRVFEAHGAIHLLEPDGSVVPRAWSRTWDGSDLRVPTGTGVVGRCVETGHVIVVNDYERWPHAIPKFVAIGVTRAMAHPLSIHDRLLGVIAVSRVGHETRPFDHEELGILASFANHAAVALENARLYEKATQQAARMRALAEVERLLSGSLDSRAIAQRIVESLHVLLAARACAVYRLVEPSGDLAALAVAGEVGPNYGSDIVFPSNTGVAGIAVREGRPVATPDVLEDPRVSLTPEVRARIEQASYRAVLALPLVVGGRVIGALGVGDQRGRTFSDEDVELAQAFADQAAIALGNARLYEEAQRRERESAALARVARELTETLDAHEVGVRIVEGVRQLFAAELSRLRVLQPDGSFRMVAWSGEAPDFSTPELPLPAGTGVSAIVVREGRPYASSDLLNDPRVAITEETRQALQVSDNRAFLGAPLRLKGAIIGSLTVGDKLGRSFSPDEAALLEIFADQAAVSLDNARLFAREKTARASAEASGRALRESESRYRGLVEGSLQGVYIHKDRVIRFANPALARIFGYGSPEALIGTETNRLMAPHEAARLRDYAVARLRGEPAPSRYEYEGVRQDGTRLWVEAAASVVPWEEDKAFLVTVVDVTERKRLEEELRQSQKMEAVGRLAGGIAHDFNNLLTVIMGRARLALGGLAPENPMRREIELIERTAERAATVTQQLLAFSRKQVLRPQVLDLNAIVSAMVTMLHRLIGEHVHLTIVPGEELGRVRADPGQIEQVIMNLGLNARDAMPEGGTLTIETANTTLDDGWVERHPGARPGRCVKLTVTDTGVGMDEQARARIFEPFFTTKEIGKGTGLGLAMVHGIINQSDGYIAVESAPGRGTSFAIYLPRLAEGAENVRQPSGGENIAPGQETILLVEDEGEVRTLARDILRAAGYRVVEAATAGGAERLCREHPGPIHLLLTDVIMPETSGRDLAGRLGLSRPDMRVLYMSGYTDDVISRHGILDPGIAFLPKPFTPAGLADKVREVLDANP